MNMNTNHFCYQAGYNFEEAHRLTSGAASRTSSGPNAVEHGSTTYIVGYFLSEAGYEIWEPMPPKSRRPRMPSK